jgi:hypothetical protein
MEHTVKHAVYLTLLSEQVGKPFQTFQQHHSVGIKIENLANAKVQMVNNTVLLN